MGRGGGVWVQMGGAHVGRVQVRGACEDGSVKRKFSWFRPPDPHF